MRGIFVSFKVLPSITIWFVLERLPLSCYFSSIIPRMNLKTHWEHIHETKIPTQVSWYQEHSIQSLQLIVETGVDKTGQIIDVGGGISTLVDDLLANGYGHVSVLDISGAALHTTQQRLGARAKDVSWLEA